MSEAGIVGMRAAGQDALAAAAVLTPEHWAAPSAASGWSVKDVYVHMGSLLELVQAAIGGAAAPPVGVEKLNDQLVEQRRAWSPRDAVRFLTEQLDAALTVFTALQVEPVASNPVPLLDLGIYPGHSIADMFAFDLMAHLRWDVLAPRGPVPAAPIPNLGALQLGPAVDWLLGGLPQMQPDLGDHVLAPIGLNLTGPGGRAVALTSINGTLTVTDSADTNPVVTITSSTTDFVAWSTTRSSWLPLVDVDGDYEVAAAFLRAVNLI